MERAEMEKIQDIYQKTIKIDVSTEDALAKLEALKKRFEEVASSLGSPQSVGVPGVGGTGGVATTASAAPQLVSTPTAAPPPVATTASAPPPAPGSTASAPHVPAADSGKVPTSADAVPTASETSKRDKEDTNTPLNYRTPLQRFNDATAVKAPAMGSTLWNVSSSRMYDRAWTAGPRAMFGDTGEAVRGGANLIGAAIGGQAGLLVQALAGFADFQALEDANKKATRFERGLADVHLALGGDAARNAVDFRNGQLGTLDYAARTFGIGMGEFLDAQSSYYTAAGGLPKGGSSQLLNLMPAGLSGQTIGAFDALRYGGLARGGNATMEAFAGIGQSGFGQFGGLERFMSSLTSQFEQLMSRGLRIDLDSYAGFMGRMSQEPSLAALGRNAPEVVGQVGGAAASARQRLLSPFTNLGESAAMIAALRGGGSISDIADRLGGMSAADVARETRSTFGTFGAEAMMAVAPRLDGGQARALLDAAGREGAGPEYALRTRSGTLMRRSAIEASDDPFDLINVASETDQYQRIRETSQSSRLNKTSLAGWGEEVLNLFSDGAKTMRDFFGVFEDAKRKMETPKAPGL